MLQPDPTGVTGRFAPSSSAPDWFRQTLEHPVTSNFIEVAGCPIHYLLWPRSEDRAPKRGLLFVHGGGAHANWWRFIASFFNCDFTVSALDLSGMGDSGPRSEYTASQRANEMRAVIAASDLGSKPFVIGHSFGGFMTMRFGADYGNEIGAR